MSLRQLLWAMAGQLDDPRAPARLERHLPDAADAPVWHGEGDRARLEPFFIDLFGPPPDDGREPGDFQKTDR